MKQSSWTTLITTLLMILLSGSINAQEKDILFYELRKQDSILFNAAFNTCDYETLGSMLAEDFEFYHDKVGITRTREAFVENAKKGICASEYAPKRELVVESLEVFPLMDNGVLYGAIQNGVHRFYERYDGEEKLTGIAKFSHLWMKNDGKWILSRELSYDHRPAGD